MGRMLGVELATLFILGFALGIVFFMYYNARRELAAVREDSDKLRKMMKESTSRAETTEYKRNLVQSDLDRLQRELDEKEKTLTQHVTELQEQLEKINSDLKEERQRHEKQNSAADEMQGIQEQLVTDLQTCREKLTKCETARNAAAKSGGARNVANLQKELAAVKRNLADFQQRAVACEEKLNARPPAPAP